jgi:large subunit ribosomal protein L4
MDSDELRALKKQAAESNEPVYVLGIREYWRIQRAQTFTQDPDKTARCWTGAVPELVDTLLVEGRNQRGSFKRMKGGVLPEVNAELAARGLAFDRDKRLVDAERRSLHRVVVRNLDNEEVGEIELDDAVFGLPLRRDILARVVNWQLAKRRAGTHKAKGISDIQGTTRKPYKQKGTGRARQGSLRSPQFRGGAVIFGPVVRSHAFALQKKVRRLGLKTALSAKRSEGKLVVIDAARADEAKTKALRLRLEALGWGSVLIIDGPAVDQNFARAARNLPRVDLLPQQGANVYDILRRDTLVLTREAVQQLEARLK